MSIALVSKAPRGVVMRFPRSRRGGGGGFRATSTPKRTNLANAAFITDCPRPPAATAAAIHNRFMEERISESRLAQAAFC